MLVFIDESGDAGFRLERGSSSHFVVAMVIFCSDADAQTTSNVISALAGRTAGLREFRFTNASPELKDAFFGAVCHCPFRIRAIVVDKQRIYSDRLRSKPTKFYRYIVE